MVTIMTITNIYHYAIMSEVIIIIIILYYRLAEHINRYMSVVQYIVSTLSTRVCIQLLTSQWLRCAMHIQQPSPMRTNSTVSE